jgi:hypothetical protein
MVGVNVSGDVQQVADELAEIDEVEYVVRQAILVGSAHTLEIHPSQLRNTYTDTTCLLGRMGGITLGSKSRPS